MYKDISSNIDSPTSICLNKKRRKFVKSVGWITPAVMVASLPAHAQTSSPPTPPTPTPTGCSAATCSDSNVVGTPTAGGRVSFDGTNCALLFDNPFPPDPNLVIGVDNNVNGTELTGVGSAMWTVSGISMPDQILTMLGSQTASRTFQATNTLTGDSFEICLTATRVGDASDPGLHTTFEVIIGPI